MRASNLATPSLPTQSEALSLITKPSHSCTSPPIGAITTTTASPTIKRSNGFSIANLVLNEKKQSEDNKLCDNKEMGILERCDAKSLLSDKISDHHLHHHQFKLDQYNSGVSPSPSRSDIDDDDELSIKVDDDDREMHSVCYLKSLKVYFLIIFYTMLNGRKKMIIPRDLVVVVMVKFTKTEAPLSTPKTFQSVSRGGIEPLSLVFN